MATARFYTIGHSSRSCDAFAQILRSAQIEAVADVRSFPRSRNNPTYNVDRLPGLLAEWQIGYRHFPALGGRRGRQLGVPADINAGWRNTSFHNYADYALSKEFAGAFAELVALGQARRIAIMCAEAVWWRCHRRIIADYLLFAEHEVMHLMAPGKQAIATPTPGACRTDDGLVLYPAPKRGPQSA